MYTVWWVVAAVAAVAAAERVAAEVGAAWEIHSEMLLKRQEGGEGGRGQRRGERTIIFF